MRNRDGDAARAGANVDHTRVVWHQPQRMLHEEFGLGTRDKDGGCDFEI